MVEILTPPSKKLGRERLGSRQEEEAVLTAPNLAAEKQPYSQWSVIP